MLSASAGADLLGRSVCTRRSRKVRHVVHGVPYGDCQPGGFGRGRSRSTDYFPAPSVHPTARVPGALCAALATTCDRHVSRAVRTSREPFALAGDEQAAVRTSRGSFAPAGDEQTVVRPSRACRRRRCGWQASLSAAELFDQVGVTEPAGSRFAGSGHRTTGSRRRTPCHRRTVASWRCRSPRHSLLGGSFRYPHR